MGADFTVSLKFIVENATYSGEAAQLTLVDTAFDFTALVNNMTLMLDISKINADKITSDYCWPGCNLHTTTMKIAMNNFIRLLLPGINKKLAAHPITLPSHIGNYFILSDLTLGYFDDYLLMGMTPTFVAPP